MILFSATGLLFSQDLYSSFENTLKRNSYKIYSYEGIDVLFNPNVKDLIFIFRNKGVI